MKNFNLSNDYERYIDRYFLRAKYILQKDNLNPNVKVQVFLRTANQVFGIEEAIAILTKYAKVDKIYAVEEGAKIEPNETVMLIEAPIQEIVDLETMYLGVLSAETTKKAYKRYLNLYEVKNNMLRIGYLLEHSIIPYRPIYYFGARHWRYDRDAEIAKACKDAGALNCSTYVGAKAMGHRGAIGTIPHSLEAIYHWKYGLENAVLESTKAFDKYIGETVPRIALIDYANKEIDDSLTLVKNIPNLIGVRVDTCGENFMQGAMSFGKKYITGRGVTVSGVIKLRRELSSKINIVLSSGFGNPEKLNTFIKAEKELGEKLFSSLGIGGVYFSKMATADIIEVDGKEIHKVGRIPRPNPRLRRVI